MAYGVHWPGSGRAIAFASAIMCALWIAAAPPALADPPLTVKLRSCEAARVTGSVGDYYGGDTGPQMRKFLGIPYAAPPTGANRWRPPQPFCWTGTRDGSLYGSSCPQGPSIDPWEDEDCLYLNIYTEPTGDVRQRPVMVWIHGGALVAGGSSFQTDVSRLVSQGVIVVQINYRLGALGFLAHPAFDNGDVGNSGNYGILDQQAALKWVKDNIGRFGGNPNNVTIFGGSAGGLSVLVNLVSPLSAGLFHKGIIQSGALYAGSQHLSDSRARAVTYGNNLGCSSGTAADKAACLRALSVSTILANPMVGASTFLLTRDGVVLPDGIGLLLQAGEFHRVPILNGSTRDEQRFHLTTNQAVGTGGACNFTSNIVPVGQDNFPGAVSYRNALNGVFGSSLGSLVEARYPGRTVMQANVNYTAAQTDRNWSCRAFRVNNWIAQNGGTVYAYEFNEQKSPPLSFRPVTLRGGATLPPGAFHGAEGPFIFPMSGNTMCGDPFPGLNARQRQLADSMIAYWTTFAKRGTPNPPATQPDRPPTWPRYVGPSSRIMSLISGTPELMRGTEFDTAHKCTAFWDDHEP